MKCSQLHCIKMEKIAIYGGSFDPPHKGHKLLAQNLAQICGADRVIIIPTALSPFKESSGATAQDRYNMCKLAFNDPFFEISCIEIDRGGKSYTIDTLREVKRLYPDSQLYLFMGDDMFLSFDKWYKYKEILDICVIVAACRTLNLEKLELMKSFAKNILNISDDSAIICESIPIETSSTQIREDIRNGCGSEYLEDAVFQYINTRGLYL